MPATGNHGELLEALRARQELAVAGAAAGATAAAEAVQLVLQRKLTEKSHPPGTPTPSAPGEPPARVTGDLTSSYIVTGGVGPMGLDAELGSDLAYSAIQEFGGDAGRDHAAHLPARPALQPAVEEAIATGVIHEAYLSAWLL